MKGFLKKRLALVLAMLMVVTMLPIGTLQVRADDEVIAQNDDQTSQEIKVGESAVATYDSASKTICIRGTGWLSGYEGTEVLETFKDATTLKICDGITSIGDMCFENTYANNSAKIETLEMADSVKHVGAYAFYGNKYLTSVKAAIDCEFDLCPFLDCENLADEQGLIIINTTVVGYYRDNKDNGGKPYSVKIPEGVTKIGGWAFYEQCGFGDECPISAVGDITLSSTVKEIAPKAFMFANSLENIQVSADNPYLKSVDGVLLSKDGKKLVVYPRNKEAKNDTYIVPDGVEEINASSFKCGINISKIVLPASVKSLGENDYAFHWLEELTDIEVSPDNAYLKSVDGVLYTKDGKTLVQYPMKKTGDSYVIGSGVTTIAYCAFYDCANLKDVQVGKDVKKICDSGLGLCPEADSYSVKFSGNAPEFNEWSFGEKNVNILYPSNMSGWNNDVIGKNYGAKNTTWTAYTISDENNKIIPIDTDKNATGVYQGSDKNWYYFKNGAVDTTCNDVLANSFGWWVVRNGQVDFDYKGIATNNNGDWYCEGGQVNFKANGVLSTPQGWYYIQGGKVQKGQETVRCNSNGWWYIGTDGKVDFNKNTVAPNSNGWWVIRNGKVDFSYNGIASNANGDWYCQNGKVNFNANGVLYTPQGWYYFRGGKVQKGQETVQCNSSGWWYIGKDGKVDFNYNGMASNTNGDWYCQNGKVNFNANGVLYTPQGWYYINGGQVQKGKETIQCNSNGWWYIGKDGKVDFNHEGIASNEYGTWYVKGGRVSFTDNLTYTDKAGHKYKVENSRATKID